MTKEIDADQVRGYFNPEVCIKGDRRTASVGDGGLAQTGYKGKASAGKGGVIIIEYYDEDEDCYRNRLGTIGLGGLKPYTLYIMNDDTKDFEEVKEPDND